LRKIGVPPLFLPSSFERFIADTDELRHSRAKCEEFAALAQGFLFELGLVGTGKSFLATAILRASYHRLTSQSHEEDSKITAVCQNAFLLVIDEFGIATGGNDADTITP